jgi:hypothetical protein
LASVGVSREPAAKAIVRRESIPADHRERLVA